MYDRNAWTARFRHREPRRNDISILADKASGKFGVDFNGKYLGSVFLWAAKSDCLNTLPNDFLWWDTTCGGTVVSCGSTSIGTDSFSLRIGGLTKASYSRVFVTGDGVWGSPSNADTIGVAVSAIKAYADWSVAYSGGEVDFDTDWSTIQGSAYYTRGPLNNPTVAALITGGVAAQDFRMTWWPGAIHGWIATGNGHVCAYFVEWGWLCYPPF